MNTPIEAIVANPNDRGWLHFTSPKAVLTTNSIDEIKGIINEVERAVTEQDLWSVGWISYEASPAFDPALETHEDPSFPKVWFGLFSTPSLLTELPSTQLVSTPAWTAEITPPTYERAIGTIRSLIKSGETYQVNYTFRLRHDAVDDPLALFSSMVSQQQGKYAALIKTKNFSIISASPELLFKKTGSNILCRPMKGTTPRGRYGDEDAENEALLRLSSKDRAENTMIVDMARNDLSKVARRGTVHVSRQHHLERYPHMFQMTTDVIAESDASLFELLTAVFPAASITGAPKPRTMRIIKDLEISPRKIYTGSIGVLTPDRTSLFNVAIRTALIDHNAGVMEYGTGSGIVWDSTPLSEHKECLTKAAAVLKGASSFDLFETLLWEPGKGFFLLDQHIARLSRSARYLQWSSTEKQIRAALTSEESRFTDITEPQRVRLTLSQGGSIVIEKAPITALPDPYRVILARSPVDSLDIRLFHKTTDRTPYNDARANNPGFDDLILWNERGELTESLIGNLIVRRGDRLSTPPISSGLLAGCYRETLISSGQVVEQVLYKEDLANADEIFLVNSLRKMWRATLVERSTALATE